MRASGLQGRFLGGGLIFHDVYYVNKKKWGENHAEMCPL